TEAVGPAVVGVKVGMSLEDKVCLAGEPEATVPEMGEHGLGIATGGRVGRIVRARGGGNGGLGGIGRELRLRPGGWRGGAEQKRERQGKPGAATSARPAVRQEPVHNENEFQFHYRESTLTTDCRAPQRVRSLLRVIAITPGTH